MEGGVLDIEFDWEKEEEWRRYLQEIVELYDVMHRYIRAAAYLKRLDGTSLTYALAKTTLFHDAITQPLWKEFIDDFYQVSVEERDVGYGEKYRVVWKGGPEERWKDEGTIIEWRLGIYGSIMKVYSLLTKAGLKTDMNEKLDLYEADEYVNIAEELIRKIISLSPLVNRKTFFLLSLRYIPERYASMMYGDIRMLKDLIGWRRITSWTANQENWQIYTIKDRLWEFIGDALNMLYGYSGLSYDESIRFEMWKNIEKYLGENIYRLYFSDALRYLGRLYKESDNLGDIVDGSWLPDGDVLYGEVALKSLNNFGIKYWVVVDMFSEPKTELKYDALIKFAAPQMFLNISSMYLNEDGDWVIGLYIPPSFMEKKITIESQDVDVLPVNPPYLPRDSVLPDDWEMHRIRDFLQTQKFYLDWMAMQTPEWEDFGGE